MDLFGKKAARAITEFKSEIIELKKLAANRDNIGLQNIVSSFNRNIAIYPPYDLSQNSDRYITTDDIYSIVRMLAQTAAMVKLFAYEVKSDAALKELKKISRPHDNVLKTRLRELKALEDLPETDPVYDLLEHPSDLFSKFEFFEAVYTFLLLDGEALLLKERPEGGKNAGKPINLLFLHPANSYPKTDGKFPARITEWEYRVNGIPVFEHIPVEDIIHIKYFNPDLRFAGGDLRGLSPIQVLAKRLTQLDGITDVTTANMQNSGVQSIVYDKGPDQAVDENGKEVSVVGRRKVDFYNFIKNSGNAGSPYFASGEMGSVQLGSNMRDLKALESANISFKKLCNAFGTSDILFNSDSASTESNVKEMTKRTYTNTILPNVYRVRDAFIKGLLPDFADGKKRDIREDISEITELQPNMKEMADTLAVSWWVPRNDALEMMHFERNVNPLFDEPLIPSGFQTPEDLIAPPVLPPDQFGQLNTPA